MAPAGRDGGYIRARRPKSRIEVLRSKGISPRSSVAGVHWQLEQSSQEGIKLRRPSQAFLQCCCNFGLRRFLLDVQEAQHDLARGPVARATVKGKAHGLIYHITATLPAAAPALAGSKRLAKLTLGQNRQVYFPGHLLKICECAGVSLPARYHGPLRAHANLHPRVGFRR